MAEGGARFQLQCMLSVLLTSAGHTQLPCLPFFHGDYPYPPVPLSYGLKSQGMCHCAQFMVLDVTPKASYLLDKHLTNEACPRLLTLGMVTNVSDPSTPELEADRSLFVQLQRIGIVYSRPVRYNKTVSQKHNSPSCSCLCAFGGRYVRDCGGS